jgi:hypothetical protein
MELHRLDSANPPLEVRQRLDKLLTKIDKERNR